MSPEEFHARCKAYAMGWKETGEILEAERREDVRAADTQQSLRVLGGLMDHAVRTVAPRQDSGLFEQQRLFLRARR